MQAKCANTDSKSKLLVHGFMRESTQDLSIIVPLELILVIWLFQTSFEQLAYDDMNENFDEWDESTKHRAFTITGNKMKRKGGSNPFIFGQQKVNKGITIWKFKCLIPTVYWIGITDICNVKPNLDSIVVQKPHSHFLLAQFGSLSNENGREDWVKKDFLFEQKDDIFCVLFNMNDKTLSYSLNGGNFVCAYENIEIKDYVVGISIAGGAEIEMMASMHLE